METDSGDSNLRQRNVPSISTENDIQENVQNVQSKSDDDDTASGVDLSSVAKEIGQDGTSAGTAALETALDGLPPKWKSYTIRFIFTWLMIGGFLCIHLWRPFVPNVFNPFCASEMLFRSHQHRICCIQGSQFAMV